MDADAADGLVAARCPIGGQAFGLGHGDHLSASRPRCGSPDAIKCATDESPMLIWPIGESPVLIWPTDESPVLIWPTDESPVLIWPSRGQVCSGRIRSGSATCGAACSRHALVMGSLRSRPKFFGEIFGPGGYCRRLYSAMSTSRMTRSTSSAS